MMRAPSTLSNGTALRKYWRPWAAVLVLLITLGTNTAKGQDLAQIGKTKPVRMNGSLSLLGGPYFYSGDGSPRNQPFWWSANGALTLSIYGVQAPFSFTLSSQQRSYTQPFNRYGLSPYYKWARFHVGYRSMRFNPYTLSGLQFFGAGVELEPKGFRFAAFYGRFKKPVAQDTLASITPTTAYRRTGFGVKIGAGNPRNFVDLMFFRAADDTTSIPDIGNSSNVAPKENVALGLSSRITVSKRVTWMLDLGTTVLNEDIRRPALTDVELPTFVTGIFNPRAGAKALFAGNTSVGYNGRYFSLRAQYKQVDPDYRSLGAFYQQSDLRAITLDPSVRLMKSKLRLSGSIGRQQDNLYKRKSYTSIRSIGSANISYNPSASYGIDLNFSNYGITQEAGLRAVVDTFRVAQVNRAYSVSQHFSRTNKVRTLAVSLAVGLQQLQDLNPYGTFSSSENDVLYGNFYLSHTRLRGNLSMSGGLNFSRNNTSFGENILIGPTLGISKQFAEDKVVTSLSATWNKALQNGESSGTTINGTGSIQYRYSPMHRFQLSVNVLQNSTSFAANTQFTEVRFLGGYVFVFQPKAEKI